MQFVYLTFFVAQFIPNYRAVCPIPSSPSFSDISTSTVSLSWAIPRETTRLYMYSITYSPWYDIAATVTTPWFNGTSYHLTGLAAGVAYQCVISVVANYSDASITACSQRQSAATTFVTAPAAPSGAPVNVTAVGQDYGEMCCTYCLHT